MTTVWIAEKESAAQAIANTLAKLYGGTPRKGQYCIAVGEHVVTYARGHLYELAQAHDYNKDWKSWSLDPLPLIPKQFALFPRRDGNIRQQVSAVKDIVRRADNLVSAGDAAREGQLIVDNVIREAGRDPFASNVKRLWLSSMADKDIRNAIASMKPNADYGDLSDAATTRSHADWIHGINMSRCFTLLSQDAGGREVVRVGRVKTPTLGLVVSRDREIANFKPTDHFGVTVTFDHENGSFDANWNIPGDIVDQNGRLLDRSKAADVAERVKGARGKILTTESEKKSKAAPLPFNLSALQTEMSKRHGFSAQKTLDLAQGLYEKRAATYPRTDSRYLPDSIYRDERNDILSALGSLSSYSGFMENLNSRIRHAAWNDSKVSDHHAIVPTVFNPSDLDSLTDDEAVLFDVIARSFLGLFMPDQKWLAMTAIVEAADETFRATGRVPIDAGWTVLRGVTDSDDDEKKENDGALPDMHRNDRVTASKSELKAKQTEPPSPFTDGTLIHAMANAQNFVKDPAIRRQLKEVEGIGTEATRAGLIEELLKDGSFRKERGNGKAQWIRATQKGVDVIDAINKTAPSYTSVELTALWESRLSNIAAGKESMGDFMSDLAAALRTTISEAKSKGGVRVGAQTETLEGDGKPCPKCGEGTMRTRSTRDKRVFLGCDAWKRDDPNSCSHSEWPDSGSSRPGSKSGSTATHPKAGTACPKCGNGKLKLRHRKSDGKPFLSCDSWKPGSDDNCSYIENFETKSPARRSGGTRRSSAHSAPKKSGSWSPGRSRKRG
ncbi:DNA topoisomerase 3 [Roseibium aggregatum]|uniref:DNA topoisomerase n=1 Tax=Roseibium aggregatum TaxID=187304 RepID=A0A0M6YCR2_9HYPH|nr:DNA topoisomerase 3 [Roseibium aggregatum]CTQ47293.1 DNA topoisomerase 3 [Roseibium aggregatum]